MARYDDMTSLLGEAAVSRVRRAKVLLVGAGGIGCELLKELVVAGFGEIHLIDLDTIDLSNLNRQFLFEKQHVKQSKAVVAAEVAAKFNPDVHIVPYVANIITSPEFTYKWFRSFDVAFNALDNAEARRHVNKMCVAARVPLIDGGSAGLFGQVQVIVPETSECFDCRTHDTPKTYPVCTIRSTPSQPIHCVVWSKSFLFALLFGSDEDNDRGNDNGNDPEKENGAAEDAVTGEEPSEAPAPAEAGEASDVADELAKLQRESNELADLRHALRAPDFMQRLVNKVYIADVGRLLLASKLWSDKGQTPPVPLTLDVAAAAPVDPASLDDQAVWTVDEAAGVLRWATAKLVARLDAGEPAIEFDKDDEDTLDFVVAATVLRSAVFHIAQRSKFEIKQMAGNIIPAVATTNAIVGGLGVLEAFKLLGGTASQRDLRSVNILRSDSTVLIGDRLHPPNPECVVSNAARTTVQAPPSTKLEDLVDQLLRLKLGYDEVSLVTDQLIYDPDFMDQASRTLADLDLMDGFLTVIDEDDRRVNLELYIEPGTEIAAESVNVPLKPTVKRAREPEEENAEGAETSAPEAIIEDEIEII